MADPLKKLTRGDQPKSGEGALNAAFHNAAVDAIVAAQRVNPGTLALRQPMDAPRDESIWIANLAGQALPQFAIVGLADLLSTPGVSDEDAFRNDTVFESAEPASDEGFAILLDPIEDNEQALGRAVVTGTAKCKIDVSDAGHGWAAPINGDYEKLASQASAGPAKIIWKQSGTGEKWAIVLLVGNTSSGTGITSFNDVTTASQTIGLGTVGTDINITTTAAAYDGAVVYSRGMLASSGGSTYRYSNATPSSGNAPPNATYWVEVTGDGLTIVNVPDASTTADGLITKDAQTLGGVKTFHEKAVFRGFTNNVTLDIDFLFAGSDYSAIRIDNGFTGQSEVQLTTAHATDGTASNFIVASRANVTAGASSGPGQGGLVLQASQSFSKPAWSSGVSYLDRGSYVINGSDAYRCWQDHTSNSTNEPGVGADWQLYWHKIESIGATGHTSPVIVVNDDFGFWRLCRTGTFFGFEFVSGFFVGGSLDLTGVDGTTLSGLEIGTDVQAWSAALDAVTGTNTGDQTATTTPYTPGNSADWSSDPTTSAEAHDRLAAAVAGLLAGPIP